MCICFYKIKKNKKVNKKSEEKDDIEKNLGEKKIIEQNNLEYYRNPILKNGRKMDAKNRNSWSKKTPLKIKPQISIQKTNIPIKKNNLQKTNIPIKKNNLQKTNIPIKNNNLQKTNIPIKNNNLQKKIKIKEIKKTIPVAPSAPPPKLPPPPIAAAQHLKQIYDSKK